MKQIAFAASWGKEYNDPMQTEALVEAFQQALGSQMQMAYTLAEAVPTTPSANGAGCQLAVIDETPQFATFVDALQPYLLPSWPQAKVSIASQMSWSYYLQVHPALAATWPGGTFAVAEVGQPTVWSGLDRAAYLCGQHFAASLLLAPALLEPTLSLALAEQLAAVVQATIPQADLAANVPPIEQVALLQDELNKQLDRLPDSSWPAYFHHAPPEAPLPDLHAIFKTEHERVVLVFDRLTGAQIREMDWAALAAGVGDECTGMQIVTVDQLQLLLEQETPLDVVFRRFQLDWGHDPITAVQPPKANLLRHAARLPLHILIHLLPQACLQAADEADWHKIIHDFQNKLLNVQLEHEIMVRLKLIDRFVPATPLPDRDGETAVRIDAIFNQLHEWASYYVAEMDKAAGG